MNDYSEVTCDMQKRVTLMINKLEQKKFEEASKLAERLIADLNNIQFWIICEKLK